MNNIKNEKVNKQNWSKINYGKIKQITFLVDVNTFSSEKEMLNSLNKNKPGRRFLYSDRLIELLIDFKNYFKMDYRKLQAFCLVFFSKVINIKVPDYTTICRRMNKLELTLKNIKHKRKPTFIAIDASGLETTNRGEWLRLVHKNGKINRRNGFVKIVIGVDIDTGEITGVSVLDDSQHETKGLKEIIAQTIQNQNQEIKGILGDGGYDNYEVFEMLDDLKIDPIIKVRKNACRTQPIYNSYKDRRRKLGEKTEIKRIDVAKEQLEDRDKWIKRKGYNRRWKVEYTFSVFKRLFGNNIYTKKKQNVVNEIISKVNLYNKMKNIC